MSMSIKLSDTMVPQWCLKQFPTEFIYIHIPACKDSMAETHINTVMVDFCMPCHVRLWRVIR